MLLEPRRRRRASRRAARSSACSTSPRTSQETLTLEPRRHAGGVQRRHLGGAEPGARIRRRPAHRLPRGQPPASPAPCAKAARRRDLAAGAIQGDDMTVLIVRYGRPGHEGAQTWRGSARARRAGRHARRWSGTWSSTRASSARDRDAPRAPGARVPQQAHDE
ncbi:MAG: hypothetical protein MZV64_42370 [Ignavibacteriales bacterium]|nr:hypothetical protein [Ignavibacteriales bacterium]